MDEEYALNLLRLLAAETHALMVENLAHHIFQKTYSMLSQDERSLVETHAANLYTEYLCQMTPERVKMIVSPPPGSTKPH